MSKISVLFHDDIVIPIEKVEHELVQFIDKLIGHGQPITSASVIDPSAFTYVAPSQTSVSPTTSGPSPSLPASNS